MAQTLKIINFNKFENLDKKRKEGKQRTKYFMIIAVLFNSIFSISAFSFFYFESNLFFQFDYIFVFVLLFLLLITAFLIGKINGNEKSYKLKVLTNRKLQNERTIEEMFQTSTIPLFQLSEEGNFQLYNPSLTQLLNSAKLENINFFNDLEIAPKVKKHILQKLKLKGSLENYRLWLKDINGNELYVNLNCKLIKCNTNSKNVIEGSLFDITHQYKKEQAIAKELKILKTERIIIKNERENSENNITSNVFTPQMAHELKTPISSMMGFLTLIEKGLFENEKELNNFTLSAKKSGEDLLNIINNLLNTPLETDKVAEFNDFYKDSVNKKTIDKYSGEKIKSVKNKTDISNTKNTINSNTKKPKLLLVEDNKQNQEVEKKLLQKFGYSVRIANNGKDAINLIKKGKFDLILMDIELKGMDGLETTRRIRQLNSNKKNIPIIAATAKSSMKDRERCLAAGMNDYISKPINITFMKMTIDQWLNKKEKEV